MIASYSNPRYASGFSLIEMLLAMVIGLIIMAGVMQVYITSRDTQRVSEDQIEVLSNARFVLETIAYDLRHTNMWGRHNNGQLIACQKVGGLSLACPAGNEMPAAGDDCEVGNYINVLRPLFGSDDSNPYSASCASQSYKPGTDVLTVGYADTNRIATNALAVGPAYLRTSLAGGAFFVGRGPNFIPDMPLIPGWDDDTKSSNHSVVSRAYYASDYAYVPGDGIPSLRRTDLVAGPTVTSELLVPGVEDFQLEYGVDIGANGNQSGDRDGQVDAYVKASSVANWSLDIVTVRIWLLLRAAHRDEDGLYLETETFNMGGKVVVTPGDGYARSLVSSVVKMRNTFQGNVDTAGGM